MMSDVPCAWCGIPKAEHARREGTRETNHRWAAGKEGGITLVDDGPAAAQPGNAPRIAIMPAPDLALRRLLVSKGILTEDELGALG